MLSFGIRHGGVSNFRQYTPGDPRWIKELLNHLDFFCDNAAGALTRVDTCGENLHIVVPFASAGQKEEADTATKLKTAPERESAATGDHVVF